MNKIKFVYLGEFFFKTQPRPEPSKTYIPEWFKDMPPYAPSKNNQDGKRLIVENGDSNATAKKCTPMLDAITTGYTITLCSDVQVRQVNGEPLITWRTREDIFSPHRVYGASMITPPPSYHNSVFKYLTNFRVETPRGYSIMIRNVAGHNGLPFCPIPAIVDTDKSIIDTNIPVWVRNDFEGVVERGTPIAQIIPFKRDSWKSEFSWIDGRQYLEEEEKTFNSNIVNNYVRNVWSKKDFK